MHDTTDDTTAFETMEHPVSWTSYTAPCRRCGRRLFLLEEELLASLTSPPVCWQCSTATGTS